MADYNSVPLGQAGTGEAFVLGNSQSANRLLNTIDYNQQIDKQNQALQLQQAQRLAQDWQKNALKVDGGLYWQPEFDQRVQEHLKKGMQLKSMGIDPYSYNPNPQANQISQEYNLERAALEQDLANRKLAESEIKKRFDLLKGSEGKYYTKEIEDLNKLINTPYSQAKNQSIPNLVERFNPNTVLSKITPAQIGNEMVVGNRKIKSVKALPQETRQAIVSGYGNDPNTARWVNELTGNQGLTIQDLESLPNTKESIKKDLSKNYKGNPVLRQQLASQGITDEDQYINSQADNLYEAKRKWNNQIDSDLNQVLPKVKQMSSILPDYRAEDQAMKRERLELTRRRENRLSNAMSGNQEDDDIYYTNRFMDKLFAGARGEKEGVGTGEQLGGILDGKGYSKDWSLPGSDAKQTKPYHVEKFTVDGKPSGKIKITVAPKIDAEGNEISPSRSITINANNEDTERSKLNSFLKDVTGGSLGLKESQIRTNQASGKVKELPKSTNKFKNVPKGGF